MLNPKAGPQPATHKYITVRGAFEHNLKGLDLDIERGSLTVVTGVSGSGKSSLAFDTILAESQRRFFYTLSHYSRQFLDLGSRPAVKYVSGLSPSIALAQNETMPSRRSTVGTLSDISELLGVCFARFGDKKCPEHHLPTARQTLEELTAMLLESFDQKNLAICAPIAEKKKGNFATKLTRFVTKGFSRAYIDGKIIDMNPIPELQREEKHTIKILVDIVKVSEKNRMRIQRSLETAFNEADGHAEFFHATSPQTIDLDDGGSYAAKGGCPVCGYSWPVLDSRYFSANSLGKCGTCDGYGAVNEFEDDTHTYEFDYEDVEDLSLLDREDLRCPDCSGTGLTKDLRAITLGGKSPLDCQAFAINELKAFILKLQSSSLKANPAFMRVSEQVLANLQRTLEVGLGYLQILRRIRSLSGGELQRLKLAGILGDSLRGVLYVLDEPSQGLHPSEIDRLCDTLERLKKLGNTLLVVDHDETLMRRADWIIDLGPGGGARGGQLMAKFQPAAASQFVNQSLTARHLSTRVKYEKNLLRPDAATARITITKANLHNLRIDDVSFLNGRLNVVSGVSGAGKSSLVLATLAENAKDYVALKDAVAKKKYAFRFCEKIRGLEDFKAVHIIDRKPVGKSSVSMPATYLDVFGHLRELYGKLPDAQIAGFTASSFSLAREGGRCEACGGRGEVNLKMRFLSDARVKCEVCQGKRYRPHVLNIKYNGLSLADVLELTIDQGIEHFKHNKYVQKLLKPAIDLGLGYLKLGQPSSSLSGGEAQRLKLVPFLVKRHNQSSLLVLDEPTTGLHFEDVHRLLQSLKQLGKDGATVVLIEHNIDVMLAADWLIDLGPGAASEGGRVLFQGVPGDLRARNDSPTARSLAANELSTLAAGYPKDLDLGGRPSLEI